MAYLKLLLALFPILLVLGVVNAQGLGVVNAQGLRLGFYSKSCPSAETIVKQTTQQFILKAPSLAASLLRLHFHDCFVRGCDGSVLLNSTTKITAEKDAPPNLSLRGYQVIDAVKAVIEKKCPGVVSCTDILALVARDAVSEIKGPFWQVPTGRRDGKVSKASDTRGNLPAPSSNIAQLKSSFASKGLNVKGLAVLSGAHTIGISHCTSFSNRLYNFTGKGDTDPNLDTEYITQLKRKCSATDTTTFVQMDPASSKVFDPNYYTNVRKRRGLFESDAALLSDSSTKAYVLLQTTPKTSTFARLWELYGEDGEDRCTYREFWRNQENMLPHQLISSKKL